MKFDLRHIPLLLSMLAISTLGASQSSLFRSDSGYVHFISEAPLETIQAESETLTGILDPASREFAFSIRIRSFQGFNSGLQREHFNENYMNSEDHPNGTFAGKVVEQIDFSKPGTYSVRAKGQLTINGVTQERIIPSTLIVTENGIRIRSTFTVLLADHDISIPRIVRQKISEEIVVTVKITLT